MTATRSAGTTNVRWFLVLWIFLLAAIAFLDRVNISIAGPLIAKSYELSNLQLGSVFSALLWGYALFQTVGGRLADRLGPRRVLAAGVVGNFHCADCHRSARNQAGVGLVCDCPLHAGRWGSGDVPRFQPIFVAVDSETRARFSERADFFRGRNWRWSFSALDFLLDA